MRVLLFQIDGKLPNLALMKLSAWHKEKGDTVFLTNSTHDLWFENPERVYCSSIFATSDVRREQLKAKYPEAITGGDGYRPIWNDLKVIGRNLGSNLREVITDINPDQIVPDYSAYPKFTASLGYSQRGCRLDCGFCRMKTREGEAKSVRTLRDIWRGEPWPRHIHLLDNDFFGQAEWREQLQQAIDENLKICFNQGINIRLINAEQAAVLAKVKYSDDSFKTKRLYTAWDNLGDERVFKAGVETLREAGISPKHLMVYMLVGFKKNETEEEVFYRFNEMVALGCQPYPMVFDRSKKRMVEFQRWVIRRYYQFVPWKDYINKSEHIENPR